MHCTDGVAGGLLVGGLVTKLVAGRSLVVKGHWCCPGCFADKLSDEVYLFLAQIVWSLVVKTYLGVLGIKLLLEC